MMLSEPCRNRVKMTSYFPIPDVLTPREREIATLASAGLSNRQIACQSSLVEGTVKIHLHNIYRKLDVKNRTALAALLNGYRLDWTNSSMAGPTLSPKSLGVATLASAGLSNKQIARQSSLVEGTVKIHLHNIYRKLGVKNRTALAALLNGYRLDWTNSSSTVSESGDDGIGNVRRSYASAGLL
jgi:DNA-binding NarL/FixJ family response regulator